VFHNDIFVVSDPIKFSNTPEEQVFVRNTDARINCVVSGNPGPDSVVWKIGKEIISSTNSSGKN